LGIHAVKEAIKVRPNEIVRLLVRQNWESSQDLQELVREARRLKVKVEEVRPEMLDRIGSHNQGLVCEIKGRPMLDLQAIGEKDRSIVLALDGVEDPHNLGAILRSAWLMGVEAVLVPSDRAVGLVATVHKVSCGGVEHVPVLQVPNLANALNVLKEKGFWVFGLAAGGDKTVDQIKIPEKIIWVLGAEDKGLRTTTERACDELVSIPQLDNAASYNVSVATGITLYETRRQASKEKL
jgi:23S rRNA (guanosine2251-2'-O)-methyltransferase